VVVVITITIPIASAPEKAAKVLMEGDAGVFGDAGGIGIEGLEKVLDLLLHLLPDHVDWPTAWRDHLPWLDRVVHFLPHPTHPQENLT